MEVKMRYLGQEVAKYFGSRKKGEILHLPPNAKYQHLLELLEKRYKQASDRLHGGRWKDKMLESFIFISEGKPLRTKRDEAINPQEEVLVGYMDFGG